MRPSRAKQLDPTVVAGADRLGREAAEWLCALIRERLELDEKPQPGWRAVTFHHPEAGYVVGVFPRTGHAQLIVEHGAALDGFDDLFDEVGAQIAKVIVISVPDPRGPDIIDAVLASIATRCG